MPELSLPITRKPFVYRADPQVYPRMLRAVAADPGLPTRLQEVVRSPLDDRGRLQFISRYQADIESARRILGGVFSPAGNGDGLARGAFEAIRPFLHFLKEVGTALGAPVFKPRGEGISTVSELAELAEKHMGLFEPAAKWLAGEAIFDDGGCRFENPSFSFSSPSMKRSFFGPDTPEGEPMGRLAVVYLVTVGPGWDRISAKYAAEGDTYHALLANSMGAGAADTVAQDLQEYLPTVYTSLAGPRGCMRISPGYRDWPIEEQRVIMSVLEPEGDLGVRLSESCILVPEKSTSGMVVGRSSGGAK